MPTQADRREFLRHAVFVGAGLLVGCGSDPEKPENSGPTLGAAADAADGAADGGADGSSHDAAETDASTIDASTTDGATTDGATTDTASGDADTIHCDDPFAGSALLEQVPFVQEGGKVIGSKVGKGWDGRLYSDLSGLTADTLVMSNDTFYIRTVYPDLLDPTAPWKLAIDGLVQTDVTLALADIVALQQPMGVHLMECSGNGSAGKFGLIGAADWHGVLLKDVLAKAKLDTAATRIEVTGFDGHSTPSVNNHSKPGASWIFTLAQLENAGAFLATRMNDAPLPADHGQPLRLLVPGWYGCCNIKWVNRITLHDEDVKASAQMQEFASRTHQSGVPALARDFVPATMDQAAMPVRIERRKLADGSVAMRIVGVMWGGYALTDKLKIKLGSAAPVAVDVCPKQQTNATWTLWTHKWAAPAAGTYAITLQIDDASVPTRRLDTGYYKRVVKV